jgi:hypothetical protein
MIEGPFLTRFLLAALATWRVTHLLVGEDGPAEIIARLRARLGQSLAGKLMDCFYCSSLWVALPAALFVSRQWLNWIMAWLALSGAACLLERSGPDSLLTQAISHPEEGDAYHVLRSEKSGVASESRLSPISNEQHPYQAK